MLKTLTVIGLGCALAFGSSGGPPDGKTGRPGEGTCADCHSSSGAGDSTELLGFAGGIYEPGMSYQLTLEVQYQGQTRWGFEMTAVDEGGNAAGTFYVVDTPHTQLSSSGGLQYVKQTAQGTFPGSSSASWTIGWLAPDSGTGPVSFYWCANACNNNGRTSGDVALPASLEVAEGSGLEGESGAMRFHWFYESPGRNRVVIRYEGNPDRPVRVFSSEGRLVRTLTPSPDGDGLRVGWDGTDRSGEEVPESSYFVRLGEEVQNVIKIQLVR